MAAALRPSARLRLAGAIFIVTVLLDQLTKYGAGVVGKTNLNPGVSFGFLQFFPSWILTGLLTVVVVLIAWQGWGFWRRHPVISGLFFGGAVSNLLDRWWLGSVRDWLPIPLVGMSNNIADYALAGAILLIALTLIRKPHEHTSSI